MAEFGRFGTATNPPTVDHDICDITVATRTTVLLVTPLILDGCEIRVEDGAEVLVL